MKTLPVEFRHRVIALTDEGQTSSEIAEVLDVSAAWVRSIKKLHDSGQPLEPKSRANKRRSLAQREGDRIRAQVAAKPNKCSRRSKTNSADENSARSTHWRTPSASLSTGSRKRTHYITSSIPGTR